MMIDTVVRLPAEWEEQDAILISFPHKNSDWANDLQSAISVFVRIASSIATYQKLILICDDIESTKKLFCYTHNIYFIKLDTNDTWIRDYGFISIYKNGVREFIDFEFNAWGAKFDFNLDNKINEKLIKHRQIGSWLSTKNSFFNKKTSFSFNDDNKFAKKHFKPRQIGSWSSTKNSFFNKKTSFSFNDDKKFAKKHFKPPQIGGWSSKNSFFSKKTSFAFNGDKKITKKHFKPRQIGSWSSTKNSFFSKKTSFSFNDDKKFSKKHPKPRQIGSWSSTKINFVLEGGSIESDGAGTIITTSKCLLNPNRNPSFSKQEIEHSLKSFFGLSRVLWLNHGELIGDDTDAHVDTLVRFVNKNTIVYVSCENRADEHYDELKKMKMELESFRTIDDNPYQLVPLPLPSAKYKNNRRLPATYANFLITNRSILLPIYQDDLDKDMILLFKKLFSNREIIPINSLRLIEESGSIHCLTMQLPSIQKKFN